MCLGVTDSRTFVAFGQNSSCGDSIQQSQHKGDQSRKALWHSQKQTSASEDLSGL